jgi:hypothetical protein
VAKFFSMVWHLFFRAPEIRMTNVNNECRALYFALKGTSKEDRAWMTETHE